MHGTEKIVLDLQADTNFGYLSDHLTLPLALARRFARTDHKVDGAVSVRMKGPESLAGRSTVRLL